MMVDVGMILETEIINDSRQKATEYILLPSQPNLIINLLFHSFDFNKPNKFLEPQANRSSPQEISFGYCGRYVDFKIEWQVHGQDARCVRIDYYSFRFLSYRNFFRKILKKNSKVEWP